MGVSLLLGIVEACMREAVKMCTGICMSDVLHCTKIYLILNKFKQLYQRTQNEKQEQNTAKQDRITEGSPTLCAPCLQIVDPTEIHTRRFQELYLVAYVMLFYLISVTHYEL